MILDRCCRSENFWKEWIPVFWPTNTLCQAGRRPNWESVKVSRSGIVSIFFVSASQRMRVLLVTCLGAQHVVYSTEQAAAKRGDQWGSVEMDTIKKNIPCAYELFNSC
jgi:hypothetical protein